MFKRILIANRGEIACRIMRTAKRLGIQAVAVYSDADANSKHVALADEAYRLGPAPAAESYLLAEKIIAACKTSGAEAVHPGYGFLSENPDFVEAVEAANLTFIGPPASAIRDMGLKDTAKKLMEKAGVPVVPGYHGSKQDKEFLSQKADEIGYPVLIKARAGGGGKGMRRIDAPQDFEAALESAQREGKASFGDDRVLIEKYLTKPRHIEIQIFADGHGNVIHLFERDCSLQRRHQKVIEEAPAPDMPEEIRKEMGAAAVRAAKSIGYEGAGTVEFIADVSEGLKLERFYFMEMNTRLQVEHPVTEYITGQDLVEWQLRVSAGERLPALQEDLMIDGWAFEARIYGEDVAKGFLPATGRITHLSLPDEERDVRVDSGVQQGDEITPYYDPMIAKLIVHGPTREAALNKLNSALAESFVAGSVTNVTFLRTLTEHPDFKAGNVDTGLIDRNLKNLISEQNPSQEALAVGALAALGLTKPRRGTDPWDSLATWRLWSDAKHYAHLRWREEFIDLYIVSKGSGIFEVTSSQGKIQLTILEQQENGVRLDLGTRITSAITVEGRNSITVFIDGKSYDFELPDKLTELEDDTVQDDQLITPMPGLIKLVQTKAGAKVSKGDVLIILEAMKMEHSLAAPRDGKIAQLHVSEGDQIEDGTVLLIMEKENS